MIPLSLHFLVEGSGSSSSSTESWTASPTTFQWAASEVGGVASDKTITLTSLISQDVVITAFGAWTDSNFTWVTTSPKTLAAGGSLAIKARTNYQGMTYPGGIPEPPISATCTITYSVGGAGSFTATLTALKNWEGNPN